MTDPQSVTVAEPSPPVFELQSHRAGRGQWTENSLYAIARSLEVGVSTLELDVHITGDDVVVVWHDSTVQADKCRDTAPAEPDDPAYPYVGDRIRDLSVQQLQTLDCGHQQAPGFPQQEIVTDNRIATLEQVFALAREHGANELRWNIEVKVEDPANGPERDALVDATIAEIYTNGWPSNTQLQSFDWAVMDRAAPVAAELTLGALAPASNPGDGGLDPHQVAERGYDVWVPEHKLVTQAKIDQAHDLGLRVVPWTVNDPTDMRRLMDWGVDGIITDYPWQLRQIMAERGLRLPTA